MRDRRNLAVLSLLAALFALAGCTGSAPATDSQAASPTGPAPLTLAASPLSLVVVGDSIPYGKQFCTGCNTFVAQYAAALRKRTGRPVEPTNLSRDDSASLSDIVKQVTTDNALHGALAKADVMLLSAGFNSTFPDAGQPPPGGFPMGCDGREPGVADSLLARAAATTLDCTSKMVQRWAKDYDLIFSTMAHLRTGKPTVFIVLNVYNGNLNNPDIRAGMNAAAFAKTERVLVDVLNQWNGMLCRTARTHHFQCVDIYHVMNGPQGNRPPGELSSDGTHPSQSGNDRIAALLSRIDIGALPS